MLEQNRARAKPAIAHRQHDAGIKNGTQVIAGRRVAGSIGGVPGTSRIARSSLGPASTAPSVVSHSGRPQRCWTAAQHSAGTGMYATGPGMPVLAWNAVWQAGTPWPSVSSVASGALLWSGS